MAMIGSVVQAKDSRVQEAMKDWYSGLKQDKVVYAVNCGGDNDLLDDHGVTFKADKDFSGGQATSGCGMHRWPMPNSQIYHSERWGESFSYKVPLSLEKDSQHTLVLKFSECYFWEPGMKVFDILIGDTFIVRDMDPFRLAGAKLLPGDDFYDIQVRGGKLYIDGKWITNGIINGKLEIVFQKGANDNPKVNAIMLVEGGFENTHKGTFDAYRNAMHQIQNDKAEARVKAEQFFAEDAYDYEERVDGRGPFNQFLQMDYALEVATTAFLLIFFQLVMPKSVYNAVNE